MNGILIKPIKPHWRIITPEHCVGCIYRSGSIKECKTCGNYNPIKKSYYECRNK